ncbi:DNA polymerase III subunit beta [Leucobacter muris]|uniref:DNA polymerase III subunit beta n=1 Tax=Leucobacter muris TaxID=1935379 RepID=UPI0013E2B7EF|nr:DNA polymerase III subunit beta [Leucobacter muris]
MKISIDRADLAAALSFVAAMSPACPLQPVLAGVLLTAASGRLTLTVYDYEAAAETTIDADISAEGAAVVHAATLLRIVGKLPAKPVVFEAGERELLIRCGSVRASLPLMPVGECPQPTFDAEPLFSMSGARFEDAVGRVALAAAKSAPERPVIIGVHLAVSEGGVTLSATDRYRVAMFAVECATTGSATVAVPASVMREAAKSLGSSEEVSLALTSSGAVVFEGERGRLMSQTLAGNFPPVAGLFPQRARSTALIDVDAMSAATSRGALALAPEDALQFTFSESECSLTGTGDASSIEDGFEVAFDGDLDLQVRLRPQLVLDGLSACRATEVQAWFTHEPSSPRPGPVMFTAGDGYRYLMVANQK